MLIIKKPAINAGRVTLKPFSAENAEDIMDILTNETVAKTFMLPEYSEREQARPLAERLIALSQPENTARLEVGVFLGDKVIGFINDVGFTDSSIELGYALHPSFHNRGYATEAVRALLPALREMGFSEVKAGYFEGNHASRRVMEKCGMTPTGENEEIEYRGQTLKAVMMSVKL